MPEGIAARAAIADPTTAPAPAAAPDDDNRGSGGGLLILGVAGGLGVLGWWELTHKKCPPTFVKQGHTCVCPPGTVQQGFRCAAPAPAPPNPTPSAPPPPSCRPTALPAPAVAGASSADGLGYWLACSDGSVICCGDAPCFGSEAGVHLNQPLSGIARAPQGFWLCARDGGVFTIGAGVPFYGSLGNNVLSHPIVGIAAPTNGAGYYLVDTAGGVAYFGAVGHYGDMGGTRLNRPVVGIASRAGGDGYWLAAQDGGVFAFGNAGYDGGLPGMHITPNSPIVGIAGHPQGDGYWLCGADGGVFSFGASQYHGGCSGTQCSPPGTTPPIVLNAPIVGMASTPSGNGYWLFGRDGGVFSFGDARFEGSDPTSTFNAGIPRY